MIVNGSFTKGTEESSDDKVVELPTGTIFYNVKDTTGDKIFIDGSIYEGSFLDYWAEETGYRVSDKLRCMNFYCVNSDKNKKDVVGAHIVLSESKRKLSEGDNFYIVPLCRKCNHYTNGEKMRIDHTIKAPVLIWTGKNGLYSTQ